MVDKKESTDSFTLNSVIGFLSILLVLLLFALGSRTLYPRIQNQRAEIDSELIGKIIQVEVLNGCGVRGLATEYTSLLRNHGFDVVETGNFDNFDLEQTIVISRTRDKDNARRVAHALGIDEEQILVEASDDYYLDATIVIGADYQSLNSE